MIKTKYMTAVRANNLFFAGFLVVFCFSKIVASQPAKVLVSQASSKSNDAHKKTYSAAVWNFCVFNSFALALPQGFRNLI